MFVNIEIAYYLIGFLFVLMAFFILVTLSMKWNKKRRENRKVACLAQFKDYFDYLQVQLDREERLRTPSRPLNRFEKRVLQSELVQWIQRLDGVYCQKLLTLCDDMGLVEYNLNRLESRRPLKRIDAAYYLGALRANDATPALFTLLYKSKLDGSSYIIARAIAQTAKHPGEVAELIRFLVENGKQDVHLVADIAAESKLDLTAVFSLFLQEESPSYVKIGLIGLQNQVELEMPKSIRTFTHSEDKDIRIYAAKLLISSGDLSDKDIRFYLEFPDWEIRKLFTEWIGRADLIQYVPLLSDRVRDTNWMVSRSSAASLLRLGRLGFEALCQVASQSIEKDGKEIAREFIEEDLKYSIEKASNVDDITAYNEKAFLYQKYFGKRDEVTKAI